MDEFSELRLHAEEICNELGGLWCRFQDDAEMTEEEECRQKFMTQLDLSIEKLMIIRDQMSPLVWGEE